MSRILLADDSPHAQRMGEFILREEGFEVVTVTDGVTAVVRLPDVDPDLVLADVSLPQRSGYDLCDHVKTHPGHRHAKVVLMAGAQEPIDEEEARRVGADGILRKPFEASVMIETARRLVEAALQARKPPSEATPLAEPGAAQTEVSEAAEAPPPVQTEAAPPEPAAEEPPESALTTEPAPPAETVEAAVPEAEAAGVEAEGIPVATVPEPVPEPEPEPEPEPLEVVTTVFESEEPPWEPVEQPFEVVVSQFGPVAETPAAPADPQAVRAAVTLALESALPVLIDEVTQRVLVALEQDKTDR